MPATSLKKRRFYWITEETSKVPRADHQAVTAPVPVGAAAPHEAVPQQPQSTVLGEEQQDLPNLVVRLRWAAKPQDCSEAAFVEGEAGPAALQAPVEAASCPPFPSRISGHQKD